MPDTPHLYLILMGLSLLVPLLRSFDRRIAFYRSFVPLFLSIALVGFIFLLWDVLFTGFGIWGFNPRYTSGIYFLNLPLGEWLFFLVIPYCCVFIYRVLNYFVPGDPLRRHATAISYFLIGFSGVAALMFHDRWYTVVTFTLLCILLLLHARVWKTVWMGRFYLAYAVVLLPFFVVNGILTGTGIEEEVVWYNNEEIIGLRLLTVPLEDIFYGMSLVLGVISLYEYFGRRRKMDYAQDTRTE